MRKVIPCSKGLIGIYSVILSIYLLGVLPSQMSENRVLKEEVEKQNEHYQECIAQNELYEETLAYEKLLKLQIKSFEKDFLSYQNDYEAYERLMSFLTPYSFGQLQVAKEGVNVQEYVGLTMRQETYRITYISSFYESYEMIQDLLKDTGASWLQSVVMSHLDQGKIKTELTLTLNLGEKLDEEARGI